MSGEILVYIGASIIFLWGIGHLIPTRSIVAGFGTLSSDNRRILLMEWIVEGLTLSFIGLLAALMMIFCEYYSVSSKIVLSSFAAFLLILALLSLFTGARTSILPMRLCPLIKSIVALLFITGSFI